MVAGTFVRMQFEIAFCHTGRESAVVPASVLVTMSGGEWPRMQFEIAFRCTVLVLVEVSASVLVTKVAGERPRMHSAIEPEAITLVVVLSSLVRAVSGFSFCNGDIFSHEIPGLYRYNPSPKPGPFQLRSTENVTTQPGLPEQLNATKRS